MVRELSRDAPRGLGAAPVAPTEVWSRQPRLGDPSRLPRGIVQSPGDRLESKGSTYRWQMKSTQPSTRKSAVRAKFKYETGDWTRYRGLPNLVEIDFHYGSGRKSHMPYWERMMQVDPF